MFRPRLWKEDDGGVDMEMGPGVEVLGKAGVYCALGVRIHWVNLGRWF